MWLDRRGWCLFFAIAFVPFCFPCDCFRAFSCNRCRSLLIVIVNMPTLREKPRERTHGTPTRSRSRREPPQQSAARRHFVAATAEFVGTFLFLFFAFLGHSMSATQAGITGPDDTASSETIVFISLTYAFSLLVTAWTMYRISGGLFNPAVTLGLVASGSLPAIRGLILFPAQILGAICAAAVASAIIPGDIAIVQTTLGPGMSIVRGVFLEMVSPRWARSCSSEKFTR